MKVQLHIFFLGSIDLNHFKALCICSECGMCVHIWVCIWESAWHGTHVQIRGQPKVLVLLIFSFMWQDPLLFPTVNEILTAPQASSHSSISTYYLTVAVHATLQCLASCEFQWCNLMSSQLRSRYFTHRAISPALFRSFWLLPKPSCHNSCCYIPCLLGFSPSLFAVSLLLFKCINLFSFLKFYFTCPLLAKLFPQLFDV